LSGLLRPRWIVAAVVVVAMVVLGAAAFIALEPRLPGSSDGRGPACSPKPCTAPGGFELYIGGASLDGGRLVMEVSFKNNTPAGGFEAVTYRHTSTADFTLAYPANNNAKPITDAACPGWEEARIERGAPSPTGPDRLCFNAPPGGLADAELRWAPDEGVFPVAGSIALHNVALTTASPSSTASPSR
jgi:hypothetical protein